MAYINKQKIYFAGISKGGGSCERYTDGIIVEDLPSSVIPEDALMGTWKFKDTVSLSPLTSATDFYVNFTYGDDIKGVAIKVNSGDYLEINYEYYDQDNDEYAFTTAYYGLNGWYGGQTINITSKLTEVSNGELLLEWLNANAVKQSDVPVEPTEDELSGTWIFNSNVSINADQLFITSSSPSLVHIARIYNYEFPDTFDRDIVCSKSRDGYYYGLYTTFSSASNRGNLYYCYADDSNSGYDFGYLAQSRFSGLAIEIYNTIYDENITIDSTFAPWLKANAMKQDDVNEGATND